MTTETVQRFFAALNARDYAALSAMMEAECPTGLPGVPAGPAGYVALTRQMAQSFPDLHHEIIDLIAADDRVTAITRTTGRQAAPFMGHASRGRRFSATGIDVFRIRDDRIHQRFGVFDTVTMLHQLGLYQ